MNIPHVSDSQIGSLGVTIGCYMTALWLIMAVITQPIIWRHPYLGWQLYHDSLDNTVMN